MIITISRKKKASPAARLMGMRSMAPSPRVPKSVRNMASSPPVPKSVRSMASSAPVPKPIRNMAPSSSSQGMLGRGGQGWFERGTTASYIMAAVGGMVLGMVVAMFFDPRSGRRRRHLTYDRMGRVFRQSGRRMGRTRRGIIARNRGMQKRMAHRGRVEHPFVDDRTLESRVQSMIFRETEAPKGDVSISVVEGFVELRGALPSAYEAEQLVRAAAAIPGVRGVHNYLHPIGTDAPNKVDAIEASETAEHYIHDRSLPS